MGIAFEKAWRGMTEGGLPRPAETDSWEVQCFWAINKESKRVSKGKGRCQVESARLDAW